MHSADQRELEPIDPDRFTRQESLIPRERLIAAAATVIGVGAIGRQVALQLAALGVPRLQLIDFDHVEKTNVTTQGYWRSDIGEPKVIATAAAIEQLDPSIEVRAIHDRFRRSQQLNPAVFCCVDSIAARSVIWRAVGRECQFWADGRMLAESMRVLAADCAEARERYAQTLFPPAEAQVGSCTARGTIDVACVAAGLMVHQFCRWLRGIPVERELIANLLAGDFVVHN